MVDRLLHMRKLLEELSTMIEADMPEAQRRLDRGDEWQFHRVTGMLSKIGELEGIVADALVVESGNPDFGTGQRLADWASPKGAA